MFKLSIDKDRRRQRQGESMLKTELTGSPDISLCIKRGMLQYQFSSEILALQHPYTHVWNIDLRLNQSENMFHTCCIKDESDSLTCLIWFVPRIFFADGAIRPRLFIMSEGFVSTFHISNSMVLKMWKGRSISNSLSISCGYCNCIYWYCIL